MTTSRLYYFLLIFLFPINSYACMCGNVGVVRDYQQSEFVAKAKIIKITSDPKNAEYHDAVIQIISLYKGEHLDKIKILSFLRSSCGFLPQENSTWIIFAQRWKGMLSFGFCSGGINLSETFDPVKYPNAAKNYGKTIKLRENVISFLSEHSIFNPYSYMLWAENMDIESFKGYKNKNSFAVFQVDVNADLSVAAIEQLSKFQNKKLNKLVFKSMKKKLKFTNRGGKPLLKPTRFILFCFFYQGGGAYQSFLSFMDV